MNYFDDYKKRVSKKGKNLGEAYESNTLAFIDKNFTFSPNYKLVDVRSSEHPTVTQRDARVVEIERMGSLREIIFRHQEGLNRGTYVTFDNHTWLIIDSYDSTLSPKGIIEECNDVAKWKDETGNLISYPCIASASDVGSKSKQARMDIEYNKFDVRLPLGQMYLFMEANNNTRKIKLNHRFIFGSQVWEIYGIDDMTMTDEYGNGIIQFTMKLSIDVKEDDFVNKVAYNKYKLSTSSSGNNGEGSTPW